MLNKFALVVLILQLARAERHAAAQNCATRKGSNEADSTCSSTLTNAGCKTCTGEGAGQTCADCTNEAYFIQLDKKGCTSSCTGDGVIGDSAVTPKVCKCDSTKGYTLQSDGTCAKGGCNTKNCQACDNKGTANEVCTMCLSNYYLTPTSQCISNCAILSGYYGTTENEKRVCKKCGVANCVVCNDQGKCQTCKDGFYGESCSKCHESCKNCKGTTASDCTECPSGKALQYGSGDTKGTCGDGCTPATGTEAGSCKTCDLTVGGTKYCSACSVDSEYPQNGVCTSKTARTADGCKDGTVTGGVCKSCSNGFFFMDGGCYETSRYPGKSVCTSAPTGGTCTSLASGYYLNGGTLVTCSEGCSACTTSTACTTCADGYVKLSNACSKCDAGCATCAGTASTCSTCVDGYYLSNSKCITCDRSDGSIAGVSGCASCAAPTGSTGTVLCYLMKDSAAGGSDPNLSSGAIAGISVAVIVIVGGLVGFLCWWFVCRGKA